MGCGVTEDDRRLLEFASRWWRNSGAAETAIKDELGLTPVRYYQRLNQLLDEPASIEFDPQLVNRLRRIRDARTRGQA